MLADTEISFVDSPHPYNGLYNRLMMPSACIYVVELKKPKLLRSAGSHVAKEIKLQQLLDFRVPLGSERKDRRSC